MSRIDFGQSFGQYDESWINSFQSSIPGIITSQERRLYKPEYPYQYVHFISQSHAGELFIQACKDFARPILSHVRIEVIDRNNFRTSDSVMAYLVNLQEIQTDEDRTMTFLGEHGSSLVLESDGKFHMNSKGYRPIEEQNLTPVVTSSDPYDGEWIARLSPFFAFHYELNPFIDEEAHNSELFDGRKRIGSDLPVMFHLSRLFNPSDTITIQVFGKYFSLDFRMVDDQNDQFHDTIRIKDITQVRISDSGVIHAKTTYTQRNTELLLNPNGEYLMKSG